MAVLPNRENMMKLKRAFRSFAKLIVIAAITIIWSHTSPMATLATAVTTENEPTIAQLAWMSGDWQTAAGGKARIEEHWTAPAGGSMIGMGRTVAGGRTVEFEYLRIEQRADEIYYVASPKGRCPGTDFRLTRISGQEAIFENPEHDFPKRISYRKNSDGSLTASIDGGAGTKAMTFAYRPMAK
jgi:Domain of unknown function (DUF6265)